MYRMTHPSGNPHRTGLTDKIANAPRLTCGPPDRRSRCGDGPIVTGVLAEDAPRVGGLPGTAVARRRRVGRCT